MRLRLPRGPLAVGASLALAAGCAQLIGAEFEGATLKEDGSADDGGLTDGTLVDQLITPIDDSSVDGGEQDGDFDARSPALVVWLAADRGVLDGGPPDGGPDGAIAVPVWQDQSEYLHSVQQVGIPWKQPLLLPEGQNHLPVMHFEKARGTCLQSTWPGSPDPSGTTIFLVARGTPTSAVRFQTPGEYLIFPWDPNWYSGLAPDLSLLVETAAETRMAHLTFDAKMTLSVARVRAAVDAGEDAEAGASSDGRLEVFKNGTMIEQVGFHTPIPRTATFTVGCTPDLNAEFADGDIAEILVYAGALPDARRGRIERYLKEKWALEY